MRDLATLWRHLSRRQPAADRPASDQGVASPEVDEALATNDPSALLRALEASDRFHRDTGVGRVFHPRKISFRECKPTESLHIVIHGTDVSAHVDDVSPLIEMPDGSFRYSFARVFAHNISGMAADLGRLLRGRWGKHRSDLDCETVWVEKQDEGDVEAPAAD